MKRLSITIILLVIVAGLFLLINLLNKHNKSVVVNIVDNGLSLEQRDSIYYKLNKNLQIDTSKHQVSASK